MSKLDSIYYVDVSFSARPGLAQHSRRPTRVKRVWDVVAASIVSEIASTQGLSGECLPTSTEDRSKVNLL